MFTIVLFNRYWLKCVYQTAGNHCSPSLLLIVWGFFPDFFVIGHLSQGSVTSQPPRTRSFISAWSSPPQFNRFAHFLGQQDMYSRPLRNPPLHNCEKHWAHTSPGAQTCRIKRRREVLWENPQSEQIIASMVFFLKSLPLVTRENPFLSFDNCFWVFYILPHRFYVIYLLFSENCCHILSSYCRRSLVVSFPRICECSMSMVVLRPKMFFVFFRGLLHHNEFLSQGAHFLASVVDYRTSADLLWLPSSWSSSRSGGCIIPTLPCESQRLWCRQGYSNTNHKGPHLLFLAVSQMWQGSRITPFMLVASTSEFWGNVFSKFQCYIS